MTKILNANPVALHPGWMITGEIVIEGDGETKPFGTPPLTGRSGKAFTAGDEKFEPDWHPSVTKDAIDELIEGLKE